MRSLIQWPIAFFMWVSLSGCVGMQSAGDEKYFVRTRGGAIIDVQDAKEARAHLMDARLTNVYDTYQFRLVNKYRVTHEWMRNSDGCRYSMVATLNVKDGLHGETYRVDDIVERNGISYQVDGEEEYDLGRYIQSRVLEKSAHQGNEESLERIEVGYRPLCLQEWSETKSLISFRMHSFSLKDYRDAFTKRYPDARWSQKRLGQNTWTVQEVADKDLQSVNGVGGMYQTWLLPIGDTGYIIILDLGANRKTMEHPEAFEELKGVFKHLLESVKIEPL